jgi:hypothetical protein
MKNASRIVEIFCKHPHLNLAPYVYFSAPELPQKAGLVVQTGARVDLGGFFVSPALQGWG